MHALKSYMNLSRYYYGSSRFDAGQWSQFLYRSSGGEADRIASWMISENVIPESGPLLKFVEAKENIASMPALVRLAALSVQHQIPERVKLAEQAAERNRLFMCCYWEGNGSLRAVPFLAHTCSATTGNCRGRHMIRW